MKVKEEHYEESLKYLKEIADINFFYKLKKSIEDLSYEYKAIEIDKTKSKDDLKEITRKMNDILLKYRKDFFENHIARIIAYKKDIDIEKVPSILFISFNNTDDYDFKIMKKAIKNINDICINPTVLAMVYGCSRQNINMLLAQDKLKNSVIGHVTAFKLIDVINYPR